MGCHYLITVWKIKGEICPGGFFKGYKCAIDIFDFEEMIILGVHGRIEEFSFPLLGVWGLQQDCQDALPTGSTPNKGLVTNYREMGATNRE